MVGCRKNCVCVTPFGIRSPLKSWKNSFGSVLLWHAISDLKPSRNFKGAIDGSVYSRNRLDFKRPQTGRNNTGGRGYGQNHPYMQCRGSRRAFTTAGAPFHAVSRHEKGLLDNSFPFSLSHMHYVGRSFRLLNQFSRPSPAHSERFSGRKFLRTEIFCRKPEGKRADPWGRRNFDEEGEKSPVP